MRIRGHTLSRALTGVASNEGYQAPSFVECTGTTHDENACAGQAAQIAREFLAKLPDIRAMLATEFGWSDFMMNFGLEGIITEMQ